MQHKQLSQGDKNRIIFLPDTTMTLAEGELLEGRENFGLFSQNDHHLWLWQFMSQHVATDTSHMFRSDFKQKWLISNWCKLGTSWTSRKVKSSDSTVTWMKSQSIVQIKTYFFRLESFFTTKKPNEKKSSYFLFHLFRFFIWCCKTSRVMVLLMAGWHFFLDCLSRVQQQMMAYTNSQTKVFVTQQLVFRLVWLDFLKMLQLPQKLQFTYFKKGQKTLILLLLSRFNLIFYDNL
jgi:hypothetical protein